MNIANRIRQDGLKRTLMLVKTRATKKAMHVLYAPLWLGFKMRYAKGSSIPSPEKDPRTEKEAVIRELLKKNPRGKFLEIGIGEFPRFDRFDLMKSLGISYVGCDFEGVCKSHERELKIKDTDTSLITFRSNFTGTYAWTLFEMVKAGEQYDVIYVDGHHTFYIDLPAMLLADQLLKPGGYLLVDDIFWTLDFLKENMKRSLSQWYFYRTMYNFSEYTPEQRALPHMRLIAEDILMKKLGYEQDSPHSLSHWWTLVKPISKA